MYFCTGLVTLTEMKAKQEDVIKERERQIAVKKGGATRLDIGGKGGRKKNKKAKKVITCRGWGQFVFYMKGCCYNAEYSILQEFCTLSLLNINI